MHYFIFRFVRLYSSNIKKNSNTGHVSLLNKNALVSETESRFNGFSHIQFFTYSNFVKIAKTKRKRKLDGKGKFLVK